MKERKLIHHFTPSAITSNFVPLIVIVHAKEVKELNDLEYKIWNVLQVCSYSENEKEFLRELVLETAETYECEEYIFMYGDVKEVLLAEFQGLISKENSIYADSVEISKLKKVLDEFEKMVPEL